MTPRTLKEVAQAGLVLGFEWIAKDFNEAHCLFEVEPEYLNGVWNLSNRNYNQTQIELIDYPDLPPEQSLLRLRDIVEGVE